MSARCFSAIISLVVFVTLHAACGTRQNERDREMNAPVEPFRIIGNVYYVGAADITSFLITTPDGHFLLDGGFAETVPHITANINRLGFKVEDVKFLLNSQSHYDHAGGLAELKKLSRAQMIASEGDREGLENGGRNDFEFGDSLSYMPVKVDRTVKDVEEIELGGVRMRAVITPGHTRGCTTWIMTVTEDGKSYNVVFVGSASIPGYKLVGNEKYPNIITDYETTFAKMKQLDADVFLGSHGQFFDLTGKSEKLRAGSSPNPFIDPEGYKRYVAEAEKVFREKLAAESTSHDGQRVPSNSKALTR
jgi:metallo-beta-lactamase class B